MMVAVTRKMFMIKLEVSLYIYIRFILIICKSLNRLSVCGITRKPKIY